MWRITVSIIFIHENIHKYQSKCRIWKWFLYAFIENRFFICKPVQNLVEIKIKNSLDFFSQNLGIFSSVGRFFKWHLLKINSTGFKHVFTTHIFFESSFNWVLKGFRKDFFFMKRLGFTILQDFNECRWYKKMFWSIVISIFLELLNPRDDQSIKVMEIKLRMVSWIYQSGNII